MIPIKRINVFIKRERIHLIVLLLALILMVLLGKLLGFWSIFFDALIVINFLIFVSYKKDVSIPIISKFLRQEYLRLKKRGLARSYWHRGYYRIIHCLILLFKDAQKSFALLIDEDQPLGIDFAKRPVNPKHRQKMQAVREQYLKDYFELHRRRGGRLCCRPAG